MSTEHGRTLALGRPVDGRGALAPSAPLRLYQSVATNDVLAGAPVGLLPLDSPDRPSALGPPASALVDVIQRRLTDRACIVEFSGGCDSSLVLSAAASACERAGHAPPIAVTDRYDAPDADESAYQEAMVAHLGLRDWVVRRPDGAADLLGDANRRLLDEHGVVWPPTLGSRQPLLQELRGALVLSGEGGDEVLGMRRLSPLLVLAPAVRARQHRRDAVSFATQVLGSWARSRVGAEGAGLPWLRGATHARIAGELRRDRRAEPLSPGRSASGYLLRRRSTVVGVHNLTVQAAEHDVEWFAPLLDRTFVASLEAGLPWHEYRGRNYLLNRHFADLLPQVIRSRRTKASFNAEGFGADARSFVAEWRGDGLPADVDVVWLEREWQRTSPHAGTAMLLQAAWVSSLQGRSAS